MSGKNKRFSSFFGEKDSNGSKQNKRHSSGSKQNERHSAGSYVQLTLLGKPTTNRDSLIDRDPGSFRDSISDKITGPQPVDAEKEKDLRQQKVNTIRVMYETVHDEYDKLKKSYRANPTDKVQSQLQDKEKTLKILEAQLQNLPGFNRDVSYRDSGTGLSFRDSQTPSINVDVDPSDTTSVSSWTASVPSSVADLASDSSFTSPSTSPTPFSGHIDVDRVTGDSGIEDGIQGSGGMSRANIPIIGMDDDEFASDDDTTGDNKVFADMRLLENRPAHMAIFLHYVLNTHNPEPLLFYQLAGIYSNAQGNAKDLKKWAYEIHSTFIVQQAPLKVTCIKDYMIQEIDSNLQFRSEKEETLRSIFTQARHAAHDDVYKLLDDLRQKKEKGLVEGSGELKENMDKNEETRLVEKYLLPDLEKCVQKGDEDERYHAQGWAIATFLRHVALHKPTSHTVLERVQSFVSKDKFSKKFLDKKKTKNHKGHTFTLSHLYKQEFCLHCNRVLWGVGFQGYQCSTCDQCVHKLCVDDLKEECTKKRKRVSTLNVFKPKQTQGGAVKSALSDLISAATPIINDTDREIGSPTSLNQPMVEALKDPEDKEISAFREQGHSVNSLVNRFETKSPDRETGAGRKNADLGRSESMKGRGDQRDRPARRSKSDVDMDEHMLKAITTSGSSSTSSLRSIESPSNSMDTLTAIIQDDSDFDVEPDLPSLKQVLGEETVRKLKPKEKKRQDVINELFYTEKCHVRNLKILDKLFYRPMVKENAISQEFSKSLFPNIETMIHLHSSLNNSMKNRRKEKSVISTVGDLLLLRFDGDAGENFRNGCAIFCRNQSHMLENLKVKVRKEPKLAQLLSDSENNPLCQRLALKDIIPKQFMRLTKYPLLIENLLKYTQTNSEEYTNLEHALKCSKHILQYVNQAVKDCENHQRLIDLQRRTDKKLIDNSPEMDEIKTFDLSKHKLIHDGSLTWRINNKKQIELHVVLLESAMVLLQKTEDRLVLKVQSTQLVSGRDDCKKHSPLLWLNNVLARDDATDRKAFFVVNTSKAGPQIYQLVAGSADEQKRWTKYITQTSESMKKNEINLKKEKEKKLIIEEKPIHIEDNHIDLDPGTLVHPEDVSYNEAVISEAVQVITPLDKLRQNDESLAQVLEERQGLIAELLNVNTSDIPDKVQSVLGEDNGVPQDLIVACQHETSQIVDMMKESSALGALALHNDSGEAIESVEDMSLPIPMDRLRDMANRMNQILTNLLAQTRATSSTVPMSQAAVNSRDEERERLRRELKFAQDELNRLRRIQRLQMEANLAKDNESGRPSSLVSESSTVSESDDTKDDSEQTDEPVSDLNEDNMPGIPIEPDPEIVSELSSETLNEISPGMCDTMPDFDNLTGGSQDDTPAIYEEAEVEAVEEILHEVEPPDEDTMEEYNLPRIQLDEPLNDGDDEESDDDDDDVKDRVDGGVSGDDNNNDANTDNVKAVKGVTVSDSETDPLQDLENITNNVNDKTDEDVMSRLKVDSNPNGDSDGNSDTSENKSGDIFHDAVEGGEAADKCLGMQEDPGGNVSQDSEVKGQQTGNNENGHSVNSANDISCDSSGVKGESSSCIDTDTGTNVDFPGTNVDDRSLVTQSKSDSEPETVENQSSKLDGENNEMLNSDTTSPDSSINKTGSDDTITSLNDKNAEEV